MASPEAEKFAELLRSAPPMAELPLAEQRAAGEHAEDMTTIPPGVSYTAVQDRVRIDLAADAQVPPDGVEFTAAHPVRGLWAVPPAAPADRALLYLFGGGHVITSVAARRRFAGHLALAAGVRVLALDYPLAPEHPFPADVNAAVDGYDWLLEQRFPATGIALAGESSGGGLVLSTLLELHRRDLPRPAAAYLMSPWADLTCSGASFDSRADVDLECSRSSLLRMAAQYLAGHDPADVAASPALAGPSQLAAACPSLFVQVGGDEVLLDDSVVVARSAGVGGTRVRLEIWPEMQHFFQLGVGVYPEAQEALDVAGDWLARRLDVTRT
jgi:monoterpene epsilon-lactone hydrolase